MNRESYEVYWKLSKIELEKEILDREIKEKERRSWKNIHSTKKRYK